MKNDPAPADDMDAWTFGKIGEFVFWFSQIELALRTIFSDAIDLPNEMFDSVTAALDFRVLCGLALEAFEKRHGAEKSARLAKLVGRCKAINDTRVRIVHGTWSPHTSRTYSASHVSRQTLKPSSYFTNPAELAQASAECCRLGQEMLGFSLFGE